MGWFDPSNVLFGYSVLAYGIFNFFYFDIINGLWNF